MHGAGHWMSFRTWNLGGTVYVQSIPDRLDPADVWGLVERERLNFLLIVGDAFARPLLDELSASTYDLRSPHRPAVGRRPLSAGLKDEFLGHLPSLIIVDGLGSSEAGGQLAHVSAGSKATTGTFAISPGNHVLSAELDRELRARRRRARLAGEERPAGARLPRRRGEDRARLPGDRRRSLRGPGRPGPAARRRRGRVARPRQRHDQLRRREDLRRRGRGRDQGASRRVRLRGRRPAERALGQRGRGRRADARRAAIADEASLLAEAERHIARYKLPKAFVFVDEIVRSPCGKADYRWAKQIAMSEH